MARKVTQPSPWSPLRLPALVALGVLVYGVAGYMALLKWSFIDALYMTVITMTTVGYTEVRPMDTGGRLFTISLLLLGATVLLLALSITASVLLEDPIRERLRRRRMSRRIEDLRDHYIVCGFGRVGRTVAEALHAENCNFVVVDRSEQRAQELAEDGYLYLTGDATDRDDLQRAGIRRARALISAVDDDAENIFITMVARALKTELWIVARASEQTTVERLHTAGANRVYSPFVTAGKEMATAAVNPGVVDFLEVEAEGAPPLRLEELQIEPGSRLVGRRLGEVKGGATPLAVRRADGSVDTHPADDFVLALGDVLVLIGERDALRPLEQQ